VANSLFIVKVFVAALTSVMFALLSQRAVAQSSERAQMAPASPWSIDYAQDSCALRRSFAAGSNQMFLELRQFGPSASFEVTVASSTFRPSSSVRTRFEPDDAFFVPHDGVLVSGGNLNAVRYTDDFRPTASKMDSKSLSDWSDSEREAREHAITGLTIVGIAPEVVTLQTGPMDQPMAAMRTCIDDLLKKWGVDPFVQRSLSREAKAVSQMEWARRTQEDLPTDVFRFGGTGRAHLRLIVAPDGKTTACAAFRTSGAPGFGRYACDIALKYAHFDPALDANGQPVASAFFTTVSYDARG
jgi:hypothetical protein